MIDDDAPWHPDRARANPRYVPPPPPPAEPSAPREVVVRPRDFIAALDCFTDLINLACIRTGEPATFIQFRTRDALTLREGVDGLLGIIVEQRARLAAPASPASDSCPLCGSDTT